MTSFKTASRRIRSRAAAAALLSTVLTASVVVGLALHYEQGAPLQSAAATPAAATATSLA